MSSIHEVTGSNRAALYGLGVLGAGALAVGIVALVGLMRFPSSVSGKIGAVFQLGGGAAMIGLGTAVDLVALRMLCKKRAAIDEAAEIERLKAELATAKEAPATVEDNIETLRARIAALEAQPAAPGTDGALAAENAELKAQLNRAAGLLVDIPTLSNENAQLRAELIVVRSKAESDNAALRAEIARLQAAPVAAAAAAPANPVRDGLRYLAGELASPKGYLALACQDEPKKRAAIDEMQHDWCQKLTELREASKEGIKHKEVEDLAENVLTKTMLIAELRKGLKEGKADNAVFLDQVKAEVDKCKALAGRAQELYEQLFGDDHEGFGKPATAPKGGTASVPVDTDF